MLVAIEELLRLMSEINAQVVLKRIVEAITKLWQEGSPIAGQPEVMVQIAIRRYYSAGRRGVNPSDAQTRVADLTKGLIAHFENDPKLVGPLRKDYEYAAQRIDQILREENKGMNNSY